MSWTAPDVARIDEPFTGPERGILDGILDWHRATLLWKCAGLTGEQLALASVPPSDLSLLGPAFPVEMRAPPPRLTDECVHSAGRDPGTAPGWDRPVHGFPATDRDSTPVNGSR